MDALTTTAGRVVVFNVFGEDMTLFSVNGTSAGRISGFAAAAPYCPQQPLAVPRVLNASDGAGRFFSGNNRVTIAWDEGLFACTVPIDGASHPLLEDLILYVFIFGFVLLDRSGVRVAQGPLEGVRKAIDPDATEGRPA